MNYKFRFPPFLSIVLSSLLLLPVYGCGEENEGKEDKDGGTTEEDASNNPEDGGDGGDEEKDGGEGEGDSGYEFICFTDSDCPDVETLYCDLNVEGGECVECLKDSHCATPNQSCVEGGCVAIGDDDDEEKCEEGLLFWIYDLSVMPPKNKQICAIKAGEGDLVYIYAEKRIAAEKADEKTVETLIKKFEAESPARSVNPNEGIWQIVTDHFGDVPDALDDDLKIYILLYEMENYGMHAFDGYFRVDDQYDKIESNKKEMLHINVKTYSPVSNYMLGVIAHEFQHLIHWNYDSFEELWLNETMSQLAMMLCGYYSDEAAVKNYLNSPLAPLVTTDNSKFHYGYALLFGVYLYEQFGAPFIKDTVASTLRGAASLTAISGEPFEEIFLDFSTAVYLNNGDINDGRHGFSMVELQGVSLKDIALPAAESEIGLNPFTAGYYNFNFDRQNGDYLDITLSAEKEDNLYANIIIRRIDPQNDEVIELGALTKEGVKTQVDITGDVVDIGAVVVSLQADTLAMTVEEKSYIE